MTKDRLIAFTDAVIAIVMTILVLGLKEPSDATWQALAVLLPNYFTYALSFFWIGTMWVNLHNTFQRVHLISHKTVWCSLVLLFFSSFFPYAVNFASGHFTAVVAQEFYGIIVILITLSNFLLYYLASKDNDDASIFGMRYKRIADFCLKIVGLSFGLIYPPAVMIGVLLAGILFIPPHDFWQRLLKESK
ncbi:TMEM175 family protein [Lactococcus fujiensis]|uniref:Integral membrane protein n=1 Tax=Lactococcus fujiensis JCM 16395 TaxID=1291764 RepID=A0A2A5RJT5_9LACT|nr:TMEM175 family protein [Lactococcus fujiensis]PCR99468.1 hypothetical protein RT41_GL001844 [Lactococcus fujiensis JCM 16395]